MPRVLTCVEFVVDGEGVETDTCAVEAWVEIPSQVLPELPVEDAGVIAGALFGMCTIAYLFRLLFREASTS